MNGKYCTKTLLWNFIGVRGEKYMAKSIGHYSVKTNEGE